MFELYKAKLSELIRFKSISTDKDYKGHCEDTAKWFIDYFKKSGFETKLITGVETNPYVYSHIHLSDDYETILVYGHYDVQPATKSNGWYDEPFELLEKDDRLYARGAIDNKGQVLIHAIAVAELLREEKLKYNVKFFIEGNEETGNSEIEGIVRENIELLDCDHIVISDGETSADRPTMDVGFRGGMNITLKYTTATNNLHSGIYGGAVPSASMELAKFLAGLYDEKNMCTIEGFYDGVTEPTSEERANNESIPFDMGDFEEMTGISQLQTEAGYDFYTQTGLRPTVTASGIEAGYMGNGYSNIVVGTAACKINIRIVEGQDPETIKDALLAHIEEVTPEYVDYEIEVKISGKAIKMDISKPKFKEAEELLEEVYGDPVVHKYVGGSIPIIVLFKELLGKDALSISMANEDCNMHGANENFDIGLAKKGLEFSMRFFSM